MPVLRPHWRVCLHNILAKISVIFIDSNHYFNYNVNRYWPYYISWRKNMEFNHLNVSIVKSIVRIGAGIALCYGAYWTAGLLIISAEFLGIAEELV